MSDPQYNCPPQCPDCGELHHGDCIESLIACRDEADIRRSEIQHLRKKLAIVEAELVEEIKLSTQRLNIICNMAEEKVKIEAELAEVKLSRAAAEGAADGTRERANRLEAELAEVKRERDYFRGKAGNLENEIGQDEEEVELLTNEVNQLRALCTDYREQIKALQQDRIEREALELNHIGILDTMRARLTATEVRLYQYGDCLSGCASHWGGKCTCGWDVLNKEKK